MSGNDFPENLGNLHVNSSYIHMSYEIDYC